MHLWNPFQLYNLLEILIANPSNQYFYQTLIPIIVVLPFLHLFDFIKTGHAKNNSRISFPLILVVLGGKK